MRREDLIIGAGGASDGRSISLATKQGRRIANERCEPRPPEAMQAAVEIWLRHRPTARLRSADPMSTHNCFGMVFAARRTAIDPDQWPMICEDDGYRRLASDEEPFPGDIVLYENHEGVSHVALVHAVSADLQAGSWKLSVISKWGRDAEYIHDHDDIPDAFGQPVGVWTERLL